MRNIIGLCRKVLGVMLIMGIIGPSMVPVVVYAGEHGGGGQSVSGSHQTNSEIAPEASPEKPEAPQHKENPPSFEVAPTGKQNTIGNREDVVRTPQLMESQSEPDQNPLFQMTAKAQYLQDQQKNQALDIDSFTGALSYRYDIDVPPGRNGLEPHISLSYNNQSLDNTSPFGVSWFVDVPFIQRNNKRGSEQLYTADDFTSSLGGELVPIATSSSFSTYRSRVDNGDFISYEYKNNSWIATDKASTTYTFGRISDNQLNNPTTTTKVYKWMLDEVRDANNNYIKYVYEKHFNQIYVSEIIYTGHDDTDGVLKVKFILENRPDIVKTFNTGFDVSHTKRVSEIRTEVDGYWVKKYLLGYATSTNGGSSLLTSITELGRDEDGGTVELNPTEFTYSTSNNEWEQNENASFPAPFCDFSNCKSLGVQTVDINGDALVDVVSAKAGSTFIVYLNTGSGWVASTTIAFPEPLAAGGSGGGSTGHDMGTRVVDINGDGLTDVVRYYNGDEVDPISYINKNGNTWIEGPNPAEVILAQAPYGIDQGGRVFDINGDGLTDMIDYGATVPHVYLNTGSGFQINNDFSVPVPFFANADTGSSKTLGVRPVDVNADGLTDLVTCVPYLNQVNVNKLGVYYNRGDGTWTWDNSVNLPYCDPVVTDSYNDNKIQNNDLNQDGLVDLQYGYDNNQGSIVLKSYWGSGGGAWASSTTVIPEPFQKTIYDTAVRVEDLNSDGLPDVIKYKKNNSASVWYKKGVKGNILTKIKTDKGSESFVTYKNSPLYQNLDGSHANPKLPLQLYTVEKISVNDGFATTSEQTYFYASGTYYYNNPHDRKFAGFGRVEKTDALGNVIKTYFHQGNYTATSTGEYDDHASKIGKPYLVEQYDNSGNLFARTINTWDRSDAANASGTATSSFVKLSQTLEMTYDGDGDHKDKAESYVYNDSNGNLSQKVEWGEVVGATDGTFSDTGSDKFTTELTYATSSAVSTITFPSREKVLNQSGGTVRDSKMYYDTLSFGNVTKGNVTKQEMLATSSIYIDVEKTYDSYGNVTQEKDPRDNVTTYTYDTRNLYPATTTNTLGHTTSFVYDYSAGKPTQVTDPNGRTFQVVYDGLDRVTQEKQPDPASPSTLVTRRAYVYNDNTFPTSIVQVDELSSTLSVPTHTYFDGLGRPIQERKKAEASNAYSVKDTAYDTRGMKAKESLPYFSTGSARTSALSADSKLWNHLGYDAVGRIKTISNVVGTTTNTYDDWKLTVTDARGKTKDLTKDARGNLVQVDEKNGTSTYTTTYQWNGFGNLIKITDALGNVRNFAYDNLGRRTFAEDLHAVSDTQFSSSTYSYDAAGNLTSMIDGKGQLVQYAYDELNRVVTEDFAGQSGTEAVYGYDACENGKGKLCGATTSVAVSAYAYDALGRVASESKRTAAPIYTTSYEYDKQGNQTRIVLPDLSEVKYVYNDAGAVESIQRKDAGGSFVDVVEDLDYSPGGKIAFQANANDTETINTYDENALYRLQNRYTENALGGISPVLQDISYTYDAVGNVTEVDDQSPMNNGRTVLYTYDDLSRLTSASTTFTGNEQGHKEQYTYDALGNILTKGNAQTAYYYQGTTTGSYANPHAVTKMRTTVYTYDNNGNVLSVGGKATSTWDYNNRLTGMSQGATTTSYGYDHSGQRVTYAVNGNTTLYPNKFFNIETVGTTTSTTTHIFLGDDMVATVEKKGTTTTTYYHHTDHLGGSSVTTTTGGDVAEITDYYPYGSVRLSDSTQGFSEQRKFTGHELDTDTNLTYMNARYYEGSRGQFLSQDPVFRAIGNPGEIKNLTKIEQDKLLMDPQAMNSYSYARNNPIRYSDPEGLWFKEVMTGQQSFSDFQIEVGQASNQLSQDSGVWNAAISHPYIAGATIGVGSGATALGVSYLAGGGLVMDSLSTGQLISSEGIQAINIRNGIQSGLQNSKVRNLLKDMFRPQDKIGGGTIEAIKREIMGGGKELTGGKSHMLKGEQLINRINNIQRSETLNKIESQGLNQFKNVLNKLLKK